MFFAQRKLQYFPVAALPEDAARAGLADLKDSDQHETLAHVTPPPANIADLKQIVLIFHGNGGNALGRLWLHEYFAKQGIAEGLLSVFAEYPGYGVRSNSGQPTQATIVADALRTYDRVIERWPGVPVAVLGESLGTGVAVEVAGQRSVAKLILISPFTSAVDVAARAYPWLPVRLLMKDKYDSAALVSRITAPTLVMHARADSVVPFELGRRLFESLQIPTKTFIEITGDHNETALILGRGGDRGQLAAFLGSL